MIAILCEAFGARFCMRWFFYIDCGLFLALCAIFMSFIKNTICQMAGRIFSILTITYSHIEWNRGTKSGYSLCRASNRNQSNYIVCIRISIVPFYLSLSFSLTRLVRIFNAFFHFVIMTTIIYEAYNFMRAYRPEHNIKAVAFKNFYVLRCVYYTLCMVYAYSLWAILRVWGCFFHFFVCIACVIVCV